MRLRGRMMSNLKDVSLFVSKAWLLSAALGLLLVSGCKKADDTSDAAEVSVKVEKPEQGDLSEHIMADATLSPLAQAAISPKITAPVRKFYVQRGSHVKSGQLLAILENSDLAAAALDNKGSYQAAQAAFNTQTQAQVPEDFQKAELDVAQTKATLDLNQSIVNARQQLFSQGAIPGRDLDTATAALVQAKAAYDTAAKHLQSLQSVSRQAALEQAQGQLTSAKGKYAGAEAQVSYSEIRSPIDGIVTDRSLFAGETAAAGSALLTVMDTSALLAKVHLSQIVALRLKLGDDATVTVPGMAEPVPAKVSLISPALDPGSTTVEVWLRVDNRKGTLKAGTPVRTSIVGRTIPGAMKIPLASVLTAEDGSKSVMIVGADGLAHRKTVKLGIQDGEDVQVVSGLGLNDTVITEGAYGLDDGTKVKVGAADDDEKPSAGKSEDSK
ncbi:MAG TPA: efflux RND transporter periplasmic adaptor subunit [Candidatus Sulfotelmatobacter sp.]